MILLEEILRAIFGDKVKDVKDASLKAPPSSYGVVMKTNLFARLRKAKRKKSQEKAVIETLVTAHEERIASIKDHCTRKSLNCFQVRLLQALKTSTRKPSLPKERSTHKN